MKKFNNKGFTIVELVIVIAVIAILAAVLIPTFSGITNRAEESARLQETRNAMMNYLAQQENGTIADNTEFYYFEDELPTVAGNNYTAYKYTYNQGKLTEANDSVTVVVEVTGVEPNQTITYKIDSAAVGFAATDNSKVVVKTAAPAN